MTVSAIRDDSWRVEGCGIECLPRSHSLLHHYRHGFADGYARALADMRPRIVRTGPLTVDLNDPCAVTVSGVHIELSSNEWRLLAHLAERAGTFCPNDDLTRAIWADDGGWYGSNEINTVAARLRKRLGVAGRLIVAGRPNHPGKRLLNVEPL